MTLRARECRFLHDLVEEPYNTKHAEADWAHYAIMIALPYLGDAIDLALIVVHSS